MKYIRKFNESKSDDLKNEICNGLIEAYKPVFDAYPDLNILPVYAWGRYYKYESAGDSFEYFPDEGGHTKFYRLNLNDIDDTQWNIISKIDKEHNNPGGKLWVGEWGGYLPIREEVVIAFSYDERGGKCLLVCRDGQLIIKDVYCGSPE